MIIAVTLLSIAEKRRSEISLGQQQFPRITSRLLRQADGHPRENPRSAGHLDEQARPQDDRDHPHRSPGCKPAFRSRACCSTGQWRQRHRAERQQIQGCCQTRQAPAKHPRSPTSWRGSSLPVPGPRSSPPTERQTAPSPTRHLVVLPPCWAASTFASNSPVIELILIRPSLPSHLQQQHRHVDQFDRQRESHPVHRQLVVVLGVGHQQLDLVLSTSRRYSVT
ncbi:MAG: hypothetical protein CM1200mP2_31810 [Planctomycetaceae bacterium]|nr:MAG: hypothetical protein CM1200mP2_31810 [Planctomycetaceae bacterium]